jgi:hypothetical protein
MKPKTIKVKLFCKGNLTAIPIEFNPKLEFGKVRAPVVVSINGYSYQSTIASMAGEVFIPLRKSHREASRVNSDEVYSIQIKLDIQKRDVNAPEELEQALKAEKSLWIKWQQLSYTMQKEYTESIITAKKQETKIRRLNKAIQEISQRKLK